MEKTFLIEQPPVSDKYRVLIDKHSQADSYAMTSDRDKVLYNLRLLGLYEAAQKAVAASAEGTTTVVPVGRYVMVLRVRKDWREMSMLFFDIHATASFREVNTTDLNHDLSEKVLTELESLRTRMVSSYKASEHDLFELAEVM